MAINPTLSSPGIGSGLDVNGIVAKLMAAEAAPLQAYERKAASYQAKVSAMGALSGAVGVFQSALGGLMKPDAFRSFTAVPGDATIFSASAGAKAVPGNYSINVTQLAQAQTLTSSALASKNSAIGLGGKTTLYFHFGSASGGSFGLAGTGLSSAMHNSGIANGALSINGTAIATSSSTNSAAALAEAINAKSGSTGVTATATNVFSTYGNVETGAASSYELKVGGVSIATQAAGVAAGAGVTAASIDATLADSGSAAAMNLAAAGITFTGSAAAGTLEFRSAGGGSIAVEETVSGTVTGGASTAAGAANDGASYTSATSVKLASANSAPITIGGSNPALAGLTAGTGGSYMAGSFTLDGAQPSSAVVIDSTNNTLEGIRDAINKANIGVNASIINDGSGTPYRLVLNSTKTGEKSSMRLTLEGDGGNPPDTALNDLLAYDPSGVQKMQQTTAAQDTKATVNGIAVTSASKSISEAIQGVTLNVLKTGSSSLTINKDTGSLKKNLENFVKAYNDLDKAIKDMTSYDPETKKAGALQGDFTAQSVQSQLRKAMTGDIAGLSGALKNLGQVGISFDKSGKLSLDSAKLTKAIDNNFADIASLFASMGTATDGMVSYVSSTDKTKPGTYPVSVTQLATQGTLTSDAALAPTTTIAAGTSWAVTLNKPDGGSGNTANISIPAGSYTPEELAKVVQASINGAAEFSSSGATVSASIDGSGKLVLSSSKYGSSSNIALANVGGSAVADVFGAAATPVAGVDVAGTIGGLAAVGSGQTLTGQAGSIIDGLKLDITGGAVGERGTVSFSQGYAYQLNNLATSFLGSKGLIGSRTEGLNQNIKDITKQRDAFSAKLETIEARYRTQFTRLDTMLAQMQSTQAYLTQQLASLSSLNG
ncbi:MAG TPA: flagellar filament capping protein FliD [Pseudoduganella sp.]